MTENGEHSDSHIIDILQVWHNSYRHLQFDKQAEIGAVEKEILRGIISSGKSNVGRSSNNESKEISAKQGGNAFATFHISSWNEWRGPDQMNPAVLRWVQSNQANMKISNMHSKWFIHAQHCNLKRLVKDEPLKR
ncbi:hypothetical protein P4H27_30100 [Paenibacillus taichungensis]|uniref:hypothetical protein n=1 Tax=Paenibacillus TaxID=44249 RepID=UPI00096CDD22|nr:hypothetical protein [Paenibacillus taichungensis]MEC0111207.1 hypothetical protein [Paenibacillus taichungensis]MEC0200869.1 hypothetical protein [Paenibacillus taichungensis]OME83635.1 hypothetical protein BK122_09425 [Paenibacillus pabuli]